MPNESTMKKLLRRVFLALALLILFAWALMNPYTVRRLARRAVSLFSPLIIGGGLAFFINVLMHPLEALWEKRLPRRLSRVKRPVCLTVSAILMLGILFAVVFMMLPGLRTSLQMFTANIPVYVEKLGAWWARVSAFAEQRGIILPEYTVDADKLVSRLTAFIAQKGKGILTVTLNATWSATTSIISGALNVFLALVFAVSLLTQKEKVCRHLTKLTAAVLPEKHTARVMKIVRLSKHTFTSFIGGQMIEAMILGVLCFIGMLIFRMPYAGAVSAFIGLTALVPMFGAWIGEGFGFLLILLTSPIKALWFIVYITILQQLENNLIYPKVVGKSVGLPGLLVLVSITIGGGAFGLIGMLIAVPVGAVIYTLYKEFIASRAR